MKPSVLTGLKAKYIVDSNGKKTGVLLDLKTFKSIIEELEDLQDVVNAEKVISKGKRERGKTIDEIEQLFAEEED